MSFYPSGGLWQAADSLGMLRQTLDKSDFTNSGRRRRHGSFARLVTGRADVHVVLLGGGGLRGGGGSGSESRKGRCWFLHIMLECARSGALRAAELALIFSLTKEAKDGDQRAASCSLSLKSSSLLTCSVLMICGLRRKSGRGAPCGMFERGMN